MSANAAEAREAIKACCNHVIKELHEVPPPPMLWHYTNTGGFKGIVEDNLFHFTNVRFLNDATEFLHSIRLIREATATYRAFHREPEAQFILDRLIARIEHVDEAFVPTTFVCCFSAKKNDLSQWRAYGGTLGLSIGLDPHALRNFCDDAGLYPCVYNHRQQLTMLATVIGNLIQVYLNHGPKCTDGEKVQKEAADDLIASFLKCLGEMVFTFKNDGFEVESEWRLVVFNPPNEQVKYRAKKEALTSYIERGPLNSLLPIKDIFVGPGRHNFATAQVVMSMLAQKGHPAIVPEVSTLPHRPII